MLHLCGSPHELESLEARVAAKRAAGEPTEASVLLEEWVRATQAQQRARRQGKERALLVQHDAGASNSKEGGAERSRPAAEHASTAGTPRSHAAAAARPTNPRVFMRTLRRLPTTTRLRSPSENEHDGAATATGSDRQEQEHAGPQPPAAEAAVPRVREALEQLGHRAVP